MRDRYRTSDKKIQELRERLEAIQGMTILDGEIVRISGVSLGRSQRVV
jgi:hypothetical protein